ncbi:MAG: 5-(carboxyamino)imidazole ribonucleotide mutase [Candidatus Thiodiazotropha taylori]|nr:5-(carboxyamino)imidazole ribonucleotide mutase [Candidatus Thiodiazotropha taylori]MCG8105286.1 5-(carboxyamino)imidazole ribonucleotide mutase [Candidatus Thiodiazotropha taylori]MCG8110202.1 5-(carboxyamino)imidazole ribonucleotide mutase [Candidatus Thiodiazotropha taylori]MCW4277621.1 5-(carboxyamino)imidazole ribonucleotide mutase [Candidatus Thiodiazotropha taylori]MCW4282548.1 5-(carboxyamino)imidazole ribonucleotide mutase [Candidatus Thiodiazotropha taylori]
MTKPIVGIIMGSDSDLPVMQEAAKQLEAFQIPFEMTIVSAHRTPARLYEYSQTAEQRGLKVVIAGAGGAAHLPGMVASITPLPVVGVPVKSSALSGEDSLLSIVQMPPGVPVATVAINGAKNAAILAAQMLGTADLEIRENVRKYKADLEAMVMGKVEVMEKQQGSDS